MRFTILRFQPKLRFVVFKFTCGPILLNESFKITLHVITTIFIILSLHDIKHLHTVQDAIHFNNYYHKDKYNYCQCPQKGKH